MRYVAMAVELSNVMNMLV